jgi:hypothetical protein
MNPEDEKVMDPMSTSHKAKHDSVSGEENISLKRPRSQVHIISNVEVKRPKQDKEIIPHSERIENQSNASTYDPQKETAIPADVPHLLALLSDIILMILQKCDAATLCLVEQVCTMLSTPRPPKSLVQIAIQNKLRAEHPTASLGLKSHGVSLLQIKRAHNSGANWENCTTKVTFVLIVTHIVLFAM